MILASIAAFIASYLSVFYAPTLALYWASLLPILAYLMLIHSHMRRVIALFLFFYIWTQVAVLWQQQASFDLEQKSTLTLTLKVIQLPKIKPTSISFVAKPLEIIASDTDFDFKRLNKIKINWYQPKQSLKAGQIWQMKIRLQPAHGYKNAAGFDYERWMFAQGISATAYVLTKYAPVLIPQLSDDYIVITRSWLADKIKLYSDGLVFSSLFQALSIGHKSIIDSDLKRLFVETGTAHLLVISGLHVGLFSALFYFLAAQFWRLFNRFYVMTINQQDFAVIWAWLAAIIYAALAGFSVPTMRALIMLSVAYIVLLKRQKISFLNAFSMAVILILFLMPLSLLSLSFWLSFLAVFLMLLSQFKLRGMTKFKAAVMLQLLFSILFIPLNAVLFNQLIVSSFLANLMMIPVMGFVVIPLNLLATFFAAIDSVWAAALYLFLDTVLALLIDYLSILKEGFGGVIALPQYSIILMLISAFGLVLLLFLQPMKLKLAALILVLFPWFYTAPNVEQSHFKATFFDIGSGTGVLIETANHNLLYDFGPGNKGRYQPSKWVIKPYLQAKAIKHLDIAIMSHSDLDHYGGYWGLKEDAVLHESVFLTGSKQKLDKLLPDHLLLQDCHRYKSWLWDGVKFEFLSLKSAHISSDNDHSCVLKVSSAKHSVLLTGDIERKREQELVKYFSPLLKADVLLVPHHGSKTSSSMAFLNAVQADYAVVTTGYLNQWGFPKKEVKQRYIDLDTQWYNTATDGAVTFNVSPKRITVSKIRL